MNPPPLTDRALLEECLHIARLGGLEQKRFALYVLARSSESITAVSDGRVKRMSASMRNRLLWFRRLSSEHRQAVILLAQYGEIGKVRRRRLKIEGSDGTPQDT